MKTRITLILFACVVAFDLGASVPRSISIRQIATAPIKGVTNSYSYTTDIVSIGDDEYVVVASMNGIAICKR